MNKELYRKIQVSVRSPSKKSGKSWYWPRAAPNVCILHPESWTWIQNPESWILNPESRIQNPESWILNPESCILNLVCTAVKDPNVRSEQCWLYSLSSYNLKGNDVVSNPLLKKRYARLATVPLFKTFIWTV